ncbi:hypothetical protein N0V88_008090 [Collariella sp. IMI 366227]|nr:hypothetical protein N0V88_008090 [Collariella sp. IMI 366227]
MASTDTPSGGSHAAAQAALHAAEARFISNNPLSKAQHELAAGSLPGGNTRTLLHTSPFPLSMRQGKDCHVWDVDGHKYLDLVGELSAGLYGHTHPVIHSTILNTLTNVGLTLGSTTIHEQLHASLLCSRFGLARVRMANTGTEANLHALAGARAYTGGALAHSGTFNNNTMTMTVGYAALKEVFTPEVCVEFREKGDRFRERLREVAKGTRLTLTGIGSLIGVHFTKDGTQEISCGEDFRGKERADLRDLFWFEMLEKGFWTTRRGFIAMILGTPDEELDRFVEEVKGFVDRHRNIMVLA